MEWPYSVMFDERADEAQGRLEGGKCIRRLLRNVQKYLNSIPRSLYFFC